MLIFCSLQGRRMVPRNAPRSCNCCHKLTDHVNHAVSNFVIAIQLDASNAFCLFLGICNFTFRWYLAVMTAVECRPGTSSLNRIPLTNTGVVLSLCRAMPPLCASVIIRSKHIICPAPRGGSKGMLWRVFDLL